ncbi:MAG TPA: glycosyltransferase 87 family protein [Mycobacteriales bacterium]|nr:glycosyltransferase 87 family protein [Mycobacteriales bacterium]
MHRGLTVAAAVAGDAVVTRWALSVLLVIAVGAVVGILAAWRGARAPLALTLLVALGLRVAVAVLSRGHTPPDIGVATEHITALIHQRQDPLTVLPRYRWNFLPFMPTVYALLEHLGLPWQYTVKIPAIAADLVTTVLVGSLLPGRRRSVQWLYATNPVAILVSSVHGQVEPTAIAFGLGALLMVRRAPAAAGLLLGFAISAKTWPVLFLPGLLWYLPWRRWWKVIVGTGIAPALFFLEALYVLHDHLHPMLTRLVGYKSFIGTWGWTGLLHFYGRAGIGYAGPNVDRYQRIGTLVLAVAAISLMIALRRGTGDQVVLGLMFVFYVVTAGFGPQYLMWAVPLALTQVRRSAAPFLALASVYCTIAYLYAIPVSGHPRLHLGLEVFASIPVMCAALAGTVELVRPRSALEVAPALVAKAPAA